MKCFERLVIAHINLHTAQTDPQMIHSIAIHTALSHLDKRNTYVRMLFIDYSTVFNTIVPSNLITKLRILEIKTSWTSTGHPQVVRVGSNTSATLILNTGAHQGCVLSPLLYFLFTHDVWPVTTPTPSLSLQTTQW
jgi:hypothetical protein